MSGSRATLTDEELDRLLEEDPDRPEEGFDEGGPGDPVEPPPGKRTDLDMQTIRTVLMQIASVVPQTELLDLAQTFRDLATAPNRFPMMFAGDYTFLRYLPRVGWCGVHQLLYHWTVHYKIDANGVGGRFCFKTEAEAREALREWDGYGDMPGRWHKHPPTSRRRDPDTGEIWREADDHLRRQRLAEEERRNEAGKT